MSVKHWYADAIAGTTDIEPIMRTAATLGIQLQMASEIARTTQPVASVSHIPLVGGTRECGGLANRYIGQVLSSPFPKAIQHCVMMLGTQSQHINVGLVMPLIKDTWCLIGYRPYVYIALGEIGRRYITINNPSMNRLLRDYTLERSRDEIKNDLEETKRLKSRLNNPHVYCNERDFEDLMHHRVRSPALSLAFLQSIDRGQWQRYYPDIKQMVSIISDEHRYFAAMLDEDYEQKFTNDSNFQLHKSMYKAVATEEIAQ